MQRMHCRHVSVYVAMSFKGAQWYTTYLLHPVYIVQEMILKL